MPAFNYQPPGVIIPNWVVDFESFTRWTESVGFPDSGRVTYVEESIWMDFSQEDLFTHNRLKLCVASVLGALVTKSESGYVFGRRARVEHSTSKLSIEPDLIFVSFDALRAGRVVLSEGRAERLVCEPGNPEVIVEIVSVASERLDTLVLRKAYCDAGISEFWLIDGRGSELSFDILRHGSEGYSESRKQRGGWVRSAVFGKSFRITQLTDPLGHPQFTLEHRD